jgi:hypothetical protein
MSELVPVLGGLVLKEVLGRQEGEYMSRYHITPWWPGRRKLYLHIFDRPDLDDHPHDHPFGFRSIILAGGYTEEVYPYEEQPDGKIAVRGVQLGAVRTVRRWPLTTHKVNANHVHKIAKLHGRRTITLLIRGEKEQDWGFYVFDFWRGVHKVPGWKYIGLPEPEKPAYQ